MGYYSRWFIFTNTTRDTLPITNPNITQEQAFEVIQKDLSAHGLHSIREVVAYRDDNFENRTYVPYSEVNSSKDYQIPLVLPRTGGGGNVSVTILKADAEGSSTIVGSWNCSSKDAFICISSCVAKDKLFWIVDIDSDYYSIDAMNGNILFSGSLQDQLRKEDPACFPQYNTTAVRIPPSG